MSTIRMGKSATPTVAKNDNAGKGSGKQTKSKKTKAQPLLTQQPKNGGEAATMGDERITEFYSVGTRLTQPSFSDLNRNFYVTVDLIGNPFFTGNQPTGGQSRYDYNRMAIAVEHYFVDNLFGAYEYYRVSKIETTFQWMMPNGPNSDFVNGELYTALDKDSREAENSNSYINRRNLKRRLFHNTQLSHSIMYTPHMVDYVTSDVDDETQVRYIQPTDRWWNCNDFRQHRWGCLRYVIVNNNHSASVPEAAVFVKHRVWIEVKGLKDVITPSVPPASFYGKQRIKASYIDERCDKQLLQSAMCESHEEFSC